MNESVKNVDDLMRIMKHEASEAPSGVSFRNMGITGDNLCVKCKTFGAWGTRYEWYRDGRDLRDHEVRKQLSAYIDNLQHSTDTSRYIFANGWSMKREFALVIINNDHGRFAQGKWVLRNEKMEAVDLDKHQTVLIERHPDLGEIVREPV